MASFRYRRWAGQSYEQPDENLLTVWRTHAGIAWMDMTVPTNHETFTMNRESARRFAEKIMELTEDN